MFEVKIGDVWEADERIFHIVEISHMSIDLPYLDLFEYLEINNGRMLYKEGHLTIRQSRVDLWKKLL